MTPRTTQPGRLRGFTLIEMMVVISIGAIAFIFVIAAAMSARESSRRAACTNHMRQFGTALLNFESAHSALPPYGRFQFSVHAVLLPYLEQQAIANGLNFDTSRDESPKELTEETAIEIFRCPSDLVPSNPVGYTNYAVNVNVWNNNSTFGVRPTPLRAVSDGTSQTAAVSELVCVSRGLDEGGSYDLPDQFDDLEGMAAACDQFDTANAKPGFRKGRSWSEGQAPNTIYSHILPINHNSCANGSSVGMGAWTAGSRHSGGANVLFLDGHARFVLGSTSPGIWGGMGTRNGGEIIETP
jgi:prepilin-type processing-associated H-X9-DG protein/prepilin-type N-terminal cleavage/methylation domain-containing protein